MGKRKFWTKQRKAPKWLRVGFGIADSIVTPAINTVCDEAGKFARTGTDWIDKK